MQTRGQGVCGSPAGGSRGGGGEGDGVHWAQAAREGARQGDRGRLQAACLAAARGATCQAVSCLRSCCAVACLYALHEHLEHGDAAGVAAVHAAVGVAQPQLHRRQRHCTMWSCEGGGGSGVRHQAAGKGAGAESVAGFWQIAGCSRQSMPYSLRMPSPDPRHAGQPTWRALLLRHALQGDMAGLRQVCKHLC